MSKGRQRKALAASPRRYWPGALLAVALLGAAIALFAGLNRRATPAPPEAFAFGPVAHCRPVPKFAQALGFNQTSVIDTQGGQKGLILYQPAARSGDPPPGTFQDPTWDDAGYLGPLTTDRNGNIYVAPSPRVSLYDNPPGMASTLFKIDTATGQMAEFLDLPVAAPPSAENPFGILGLAYDCDTHSLYASSVAGSTRTQALGRIFRIDLGSGRVASELDAVDAFGLAIFNGVSGKRLYFGSARASEILSLALDVTGNVAGIPRLEVSLAGWGVNGDDKARRVIFNNDNTMTVRGLPFEFNLIATSERPQSEYRLQYLTNNDSWQLLSIDGP